MHDEMCTEKNILQSDGTKMEYRAPRRIFERCKSKMLIAFNDLYAVRNKLKTPTKRLWLQIFGGVS